MKTLIKPTGRIRSYNEEPMYRYDMPTPFVYGGGGDMYGPEYTVGRVSTSATINLELTTRPNENILHGGDCYLLSKRDIQELIRKISNRLVTGQPIVLEI